MNDAYLFRTDDDNLKDTILKDILQYNIKKYFISKDQEKLSADSSNVNIGPVVCICSLNSYILFETEFIDYFYFYVFYKFLEYYTCKHVIEDIK